MTLKEFDWEQRYSVWKGNPWRVRTPFGDLEVAESKKSYVYNYEVNLGDIKLGGISAATHTDAKAQAEKLYGEWLGHLLDKINSQYYH